MPKISQRKKVFIGIDPGVNGGLAAILPSREVPSGVVASPMPPTERDLWDWFQPFRPFYDGSEVVAIVEWIHPAIQQVAKSHMSKLYGNYMAIRMALTASGVSFQTVQAMKWQPAVGVERRKKSETVTKWKDRLRGRAQQLYPDLHYWKQNVTEQRKVSDALLIAHHCKQLHR